MMSTLSTPSLQEEMMQLYESGDYLGVVLKARAVDRYTLSDAQILLLAASYFHLGRQDISFFKSGTSFLLPLDHLSLQCYPQWHFYMGMSLFGICNYARAFKHFHEFLSLNEGNDDPNAQERQEAIAQRMKSCQAFLTLPFFNHSFARRVKNFWLQFDTLLPTITLYADKLNHVKQEQRRTRSRSFHGAQNNFRDALEQVKTLLGSLLPGQKFSLRFLPRHKSQAKFELIFPVGKFITRLHALKYFVSQASNFVNNSEQFICTLGIPIYDNYDCQFGGHHINASDVIVLLKLNEHGQWPVDNAHEILLYSPALADCTDLLRAHLLTQLLYHNSGELSTHMYFDVITIIDDADYQELSEHIFYDHLSYEASDDTILAEGNEDHDATCAASDDELYAQHHLEYSPDNGIDHALLNTDDTLDKSLTKSKLSNALASEDSILPAPDTANAGNYLQLSLTELNDFLRAHSLSVEQVDFNEYWLNNSLDIFSQVLFDNGLGGEISEDMDESIALRLEAFWTLTNCYELEDYMTEYDQSAALSCYDWGIMPCFLIIPLSNLKLPKSYFKSDKTIAQDKLEQVKQKLLNYKKNILDRLYNHCQSHSFSCTGIAMSHEFFFIDFMLWEPFCALAGLHKIFEQDQFTDVGLKSFHPYTTEMALEDLGFTLNQTTSKS